MRVIERVKPYDSWLNTDDDDMCPEHTEHLYNIYTMSAQRLRRWSNIV